MIALSEILEKVGLSEKEAQIYLLGLELGSQSASVFAKRAEVNRSSVYRILQNLINKGLMGSFDKNGVFYFESVPPARLLNYVDSRRNHLDACKMEISDMLSRFESLSSPLSPRPKIRYFEGFAGVQLVMEETLEATEPLRCYSSLHRWLDTPELADYIRAYGKRRVFERKIPLKALVHISDITQEYLQNEYPTELFDFRFIPDGIAIVDNEINIYNDKVAIVSLKPLDYFGVIIESPQIADTQKSIFELAWMAAHIKKHA